MNRIVLSPSAADPPVRILLTGLRAWNRTLIIIDGRPILLTYTHFIFMVALLMARGDANSTGFASARRNDPINRIECCRLRRELTELFGDGAGMMYIKSGHGEEYALAVARDEIALDPSAHELVDLGVLTSSELAKLQSLFPTLTERWEGKMPDLPIRRSSKKSVAPATVRLVPEQRTRTTTANHLSSVG